MSTLDSMIAPRALTALELASVAAPHILTYAVAHRAFTFASLWDADGATTSTAEHALDDIADAGVASVGEWLADCETDGEPRFYRKASVKPALVEMCRVAARIACGTGDGELAAFVTRLEERDPTLMEQLVFRAS